MVNAWNPVPYRPIITDDDWVSPWAAWRFPHALSATRCPGRLPTDPYTGEVDPDLPRLPCATLVPIEWGPGVSAVPYVCPDTWCGFAGMFIRPPTTVRSRLVAAYAWWARKVHR